MKILLTTLFAGASLINVLSCALGRKKPRRVSKVLLMPLLAGVYLLYAAEPSRLVVAALFMGWLGDILLIFKERGTMLRLGMAAFGLGHVLYVTAIFTIKGVRPPLWAAIVIPAAVLCGALLFFRRLNKSLPEGMRLPTLCYLLLLTTLPVAAALSLAGGAAGGWALLVGGVLFLISDGTLSIETFVLGDSAKLDFIVMLTYITAQFMLTLGFCPI